MAVFERQALQRWVAELTRYATKFAPDLVSVAGVHLEPIVEAAVDRAAAHGFTDRGPCRFFLEMLLSYGWGFDTDPMLPWAALALTNPADQHTRANWLYSASNDYIAAVCGPNDRFTALAMRHAASLVDVSLPRTSAPVEDRIASLLRDTYPEKFDYAGAPAVARLFPAVAAIARQYGIHDDYGSAVLAGALFAFGHQAASDPLYPWVAASLTGNASASERVASLHRRLSTYMTRAAGVLEQPR